jgi:hypothetical protein
MKKTLLALVLAVGLVSAKADTYDVGQENSFYLGFYAADEVSTRSVIVNLGRSADVFNGISLNQSALGSVLSSTYGTGWYNNSQVFYSVFGYNGNYGDGGSLFAGRQSAQPLLENSFESTTLNEDNYWTYSDQIGAVLAAHNAGGAEKSYVTGSTGHQHQFSVVDNSAVSFSGKADSAWTIFTSPVYAQVTSNLSVQEFANNGSGSFETVSSGPSFDVSVQSTGGVVSVVPEPSTYALIGVASLLFVVVYRRKTA